MAFKAEELMAQVFPGMGGDGLFACPENTVKKPCPQNTHVQCPESSRRDCGGGSAAPCPENTVNTGPVKKRAGGRDRTDLSLLQAQLRERMAQNSAGL